MDEGEYPEDDLILDFSSDAIRCKASYLGKYKIKEGWMLNGNN